MLTRRAKADAQNNYSASPPGNTFKSCPNKETDISENEQIESHWVKIELLGEDDKPIPGETYRVELPDGTLVKEGSLDMNGQAGVEGITAEECLVSFPNLGDECWEQI